MKILRRLDMDRIFKWHPVNPNSWEIRNYGLSSEVWDPFQPGTLKHHMPDWFRYAPKAPPGQPRARDGWWNKPRHDKYRERAKMREFCKAIENGKVDLDVVQATRRKN
jgi:hypothetical protein